MRRYWVEAASSHEDSLVIAGDEFHHIINVCRQAVGSRFEIITPDSYALMVEVKALLKKQAHVEVVERRKIPALPEPHIHLCLSLPKMDTFERVLEKSVELGVHSVRPMISDYSFVKSTKKIMGSKAPRFQKIIKGATQQTGRGEIMKLHEPQSLQETLQLAQQEQALTIFSYEGDGGSPLSEVLKPKELSKSVWIFVGSEGGFSDQEVKLFQGVGVNPMSLGEQVLRVETACVTLLSVIKYELGLF